jgi:hypothetical protein
LLDAARGAYAVVPIFWERMLWQELLEERLLDAPSKRANSAIAIAIPTDAGRDVTASIGLAGVGWRATAAAAFCMCAPAVSVCTAAAAACAAAVIQAVARLRLPAELSLSAGHHTLS